MIHVLHHKYRLTLWPGERNDSGPAVRAEFDTLEEAQAEMKLQQDAGRYRSGLLIRWHAASGVSELVALYPDPKA